MNLKRTTFCLFFLFLSVFSSQAQELNCNLQINTAQIQLGDKRIFETLQKALYEFVNGRKWTDFNLAPTEKIECGMTITVNKRDATNNIIEATITVQARRPVFESSYSSPTLNVFDKDFSFRYVEYDPIEFSDHSISNNLTAVLAYYSYLILGVHFDSFGLGAGKAFFEKAQNVVNLSQGLEFGGWQASERNQANRYWQIESYTNGAYAAIHDIIYQYHRKGMDNMYKDPKTARENIYQAISLIKGLNALKLGLPAKQLFMESKAEELVNIYSPLPAEEKQKIMSLLMEVDPSNAAKYQKITNPSNR